MIEFIHPFPRWLDIVLFVLVFGVCAVGVFFFVKLNDGLSTYTAYVPHAIAAFFIGLRGARTHGRLISKKEAFKFSIWATIPTLLLFGGFFYIVVAFTSPPGHINRDAVTFFGSMFVAAILASIVVVWVFTLLGSWFSPIPSDKKKSK